MRASHPPKQKSIPQIHREMVRDLLSDRKPIVPMRSAWSQWSLWLSLSILMLALAMTLMKMEPDMDSLAKQMPSMTFIFLAFLGSALAAWEAIASSVPGRQTSPAYRWLASGVLAALFLFPILFFAPSPQHLNALRLFEEGHACLTNVSLLGLPPWLLLVFLVSRNAAFHPAWTGAWTGASAFLLGMMAVQMHCPNNQWSHVLMMHLLPVAVAMVLASWAGLWLFSRWKK
ncbi:MAG TPA: NrsF family protein [bacterium]|nr:NrsF family protein [bacterium]